MVFLTRSTSAPISSINTNSNSSACKLRPVSDLLTTREAFAGAIFLLTMVLLARSRVESKSSGVTLTSPEAKYPAGAAVSLIV
jgi:preprotein translocase subunit SecG